MFTKIMMVSPKLFGYSMAGGFMLSPEVIYPISQEHFVGARLSLGLAASSFSPGQIMQQQLRRLAIKWESRILKEYLVFLEDETSQFLLKSGNLSELANGVSVGVQF